MREQLVHYNHQLLFTKQFYLLVIFAIFVKHRIQILFEPLKISKSKIDNQIKFVNVTRYFDSVAYQEGAILKIGYYSILIMQKPVVVNYKNGVVKTMNYQLKLEICETNANQISL